jgi:hypothetical protein
VLSKVCRWLAPLGAAAILFTGAPAAVAAGIVDPGPVAPNQYFVALVNGSTVKSSIAVICDGPPGALVRIGHPAAGQTAEVLPAPLAIPQPPVGVGFTGSAGTAIGFVLSPADATPPVVLRFYQTTAPIPTSITVPCSGTAPVAFVPGPGSPTARPAVISVTFTSIS